MAQRTQNPDVLSGQAVARLLGINYKTFLKRKAVGDVPPSMNRTGRLQWHRATVEAWMRSGAHAPEQVA